MCIYIIYVYIHILLLNNANDGEGKDISTPYKRHAGDGEQTHQWLLAYLLQDFSYRSYTCALWH